MTISRPVQRSEVGAGVTAMAAAAGRTLGKLPVPVVLYLIVVMLPVGFNLGPLYMTLQRLLLLLLIVPLMVKLLAGRFGRIMWTDTLFFLHIGWATVAIAANNPDMVVQNTGSAAVEFLGGYLVGRACIRSREDFLALCRWLGLAVCCTLPFALYEARTGNPIIITFINSLPGIRSVGNVNIEPRLGLQRAQVFLAHPIHYGLFCSTAFALTLLGLKGVLTNMWRFLMAGAIALCVFLSLSSGAMLPLILQSFLMVWVIVFQRTGRPWLLLLVLIAAAYVTIDLLSNRTPMRVFMTYATFSAHNAYWRGQIFTWGMVNVWANPIFGLGLNDWVRPFYMYSGSMDNFWLVMAVRYGIPGFSLIAAGYFIALWRIGRRDFSSDPDLIRIRRAWMFTFIGLSLALCTVHVWTTVYSYVFFLFGAGMWLVSEAPAPARTPATAAGRSGDVRMRATDPEPSSLPVAATGSTSLRGGPRYTRFPVRPVDPRP